MHDCVDHLVLNFPITKLPNYTIELASSSLKCSLYVLDRITQHHRPAMRTGHWTLGLREFLQQPFHLVPLQRHVDLDGGVARDRCGDAMADCVQVHCLLLALELDQQLAQHLLDVARLHSCRHSFHHHSTRAKEFDLESIAL